MHFFSWRSIWAVVLVIAVVLLTACTNLFSGSDGNKSDMNSNAGETTIQADDSEEHIDLDFTVCEEGRLPDELLEMIEEKKAEPFKLTFITREYMYIVVGYGAQQRGGCSVTVNELYRTSQAVYIDTNLVGVEGETIQINGMTYPYVAVKCENQNLPVVYE